MLVRELFELFVCPGIRNRSCEQLSEFRETSFEVLR